MIHFNIFTNLDAMRLIRNMKRTPENAVSLKMAHFNNVGVIEVFLEATPTTLITNFLLGLSFDNDNLRNILLGEGSASGGISLGGILFLMGYAASYLSSAFGVSR